MFLQHITHIIGRRPLYLPPFMIFLAGAASKMSHQALCHMNKPWTPIPAARAGRVHHTRVAVHTLSENKVTTTAKRFWSDGFIFKFSVHLHLKRRSPRGLFQRRRLLLQHRFVKWLLFRANRHFTAIHRDTAAVFHSVGSSGLALGKKCMFTPSQGQMGNQKVPEQTLNPRPSERHDCMQIYSSPFKNSKRKCWKSWKLVYARILRKNTLDENALFFGLEIKWINRIHIKLNKMKDNILKFNAE